MRLFSKQKFLIINWMCLHSYSAINTRHLHINKFVYLVKFPKCLWHLTDLTVRIWLWPRYDYAYGFPYRAKSRKHSWISEGRFVVNFTSRLLSAFGTAIEEAKVDFKCFTWLLIQRQLPHDFWTHTCQLICVWF